MDDDHIDLQAEADWPLDAAERQIEAGAVECRAQYAAKVAAMVMGR